ncbi:peptidoglycan-binding domain-containing protein [Paracoccus lutimaris]|uniref:Peptidoglycan binding protein n=1 Tax=Paracoccus lutimaris TaxID=1490030 RepID=A0A368Z3Q4_9RHOB|nr:peptidoglycan-binding domain-containing protein [Paracoccus lutimaris]RCW87051.1 hypothetical protein DFP89_10355 [Paracoccus lutimaris]
MGKRMIVATSRIGLALGGWLACATLALAQGGLVIAPLPSDVVIGAQSNAAPTETVLPAGAVVTALTPADPGLSALPAAPRAGLPRPSIIVGDMAILAAMEPRGPLGLSFALREVIRQRDIALFERLLGRGVLDPDPDRMAEAIQTELRRADCYTGRIDGDWGSGSVRAVERWRQAAGASVAGDPQPQLFRAIARSGDLRCAAIVAPVVVATPPRGGAGGGGSGGGGASGRPKPVAAKPAQPAKPVQPAKPATTSPQFNPSMIGSGMFR